MNELEKMPEPKTAADELQPLLDRLEKHRQRLLNMTPEEKAARQSEIDAQARAERQAIVAGLRDGWNVPLRHAQCVPDLTGEWGNRLKMLSKIMAGEDGVTIGLVGGRGSGKTQMAVMLMRERTRNLKSARFTTATEFFIKVKASYDKESETTEEAVLRKFAGYSLLVVDEVGKRGGSEWENNLLFEMLNRRYNACRDTILIDNRTKAEFIATIGPSLASRMTEGGGIIECNWPSFRK